MLQGYPSLGDWVPGRPHRSSQSQCVWAENFQLPSSRQYHHVACQVATLPSDVCLRGGQADQQVSYMVGSHR